MARQSRRQFVRSGLAVAGLGLLTGGGLLAYRALQRPPVPRIGFLALPTANSPTLRRQIEVFQQGLREVGYVEGQNLTIEWRYADNNIDQFRALAAELVGLPVDLIVVTGGADSVVKEAITTVPVVFAVSGNPVGTGVVQSLARPGGNLTGFDVNSSQLGSKQLDLLKQTVPSISCVAYVFTLSNLSALEDAMREREEAARGLGITLLRFRLESAADLSAAFEEAGAKGADALLAGTTVPIGEWAPQILELAMHYRLPSMFASRGSAQAGALFGYGADALDLYRRAPIYVDKILKGANPAELPIEQPTKYDFVVNLKTARALGLTVPQGVLLQATEIIE